MSEPSPDTWSRRDLPVLRAVVEAVDEHQFADNGSLEAATDLDPDEIQRALRALAGDRYIQHSTPRGDGTITLITGVSGRARREAGSWPTPESAAERMITALEQIAANGTDEEKTRARKILEAFTGAGQQIAVGVATAMITGQAG